MYENIDQGNSPVRESDIPNAIRQLEEAVKYINADLNMLQEKLNPAMRQFQGQPGGKSDDASDKCVLALQILACVDDLSDSRERILSLCSRVEL